MTDAELLQEEISEIEADIFRLRGSLQKQDNGVKLKRIEIKTRTLGRLNRWLNALKKREEAA